MKIDKVYCLCLDKRIKYSSLLEKECHEVGLPFTPFIAGDGKTLPACMYDLIDEENPDVSNWGYGRDGHKKHHYNAFKCHQKMLQKAKEEGAETVLFLEDDAYITSRFKAVFANIVDLLDPCWSMLYLGWWMGDENDLWNMDIENAYNEKGFVGIGKCVQVGGLHGVAIHNSMFDTLLSLQPVNPIDYQLNQMGHGNINSYFVLPKIIHTRSVYSFCEGSVINRNEI